MKCPVVFIGRPCLVQDADTDGNQCKNLQNDGKSVEWLVAQLALDSNAKLADREFYCGGCEVIKTYIQRERLKR